MPNVNALSTEVGAVAGFNSQSLQVVATSTAVSCAPIVALSPSYAITRKPAGSSATFAGASITPDVAGLYQLTVTNGGIAFTFWLVALSAAALARSVGGPSTPAMPSPTVGLLLATLLSQTTTWSAATFAASVELATPGPTNGVDGRLFGAATASPINWAAVIPG